MSLLSELVGEGGAAVASDDRPLRSEARERVNDEDDEEELFSSDGEEGERQHDRRWTAAQEGKTNVTKIDGRTDSVAN